ncbi:MAG: peptidylprolyl isomerase [Candidatus Sulfobium sp.]|jgi:peptidylprolyl isomerase
MTAVKKGDTIRIHYKGKLEDGTVFDSTEGGASLELTVGNGEFLAGLENGVMGMEAGESKTLFIPAEEGYGQHKKERVFEYDRNKLPEGFQPAVGLQMQMYRADGMPVTVTLVGVSESTVTMDCNHPLAGKNLIFDITLEDIVRGNNN